MEQAEKANRFKSLHTAGRPLVLYNIWDAAGAKTLEDAGADAVATGSYSVAAAHGYDDGHSIPLDFVLQIVERIAASVSLPVTIDFEGGYATAPEAVAANVRRVLDAGAIGINFEDQIVGSDGLHPLGDQAKRIAAIRKMADDAGVPMFINARTDLFLKAKPDDHDGLYEAATERGAAYADAGADGFFVPGLASHDLIGRLCSAVRLTVNVMMKSGLGSIADLASLGVGRVSFGPAPFRTAMADLKTRFDAIQ